MDLQKSLNEFVRYKNKEQKVLDFLHKNKIDYEDLTEYYGYFRIRINNIVDEYEDIFYSDFDKMWIIKKYVIYTKEQRQKDYEDSMQRINTLYKNGMCNISSEY